MVIGKMTREIISFISLLVYFVTANAMCVSDSDCKMQFPGHIMRCIGNTCEKEVGVPCEEDVDCSIKNSLCDATTKKCQCKNGYEDFGEKNSVCAKALYTQCAVDDDCITNAKCTQNRCNCDAQEGFIPTKDSRRCLHKSTGFNSPCNNTQNCPDWGDGTACANDLCGCQPAFHFYEDKCYYTLKLKETCAIDDKKRRCYLPDDEKDQHVTCNTNTKTCECERGYKPSDDEKKCSSAPAASLLSLGCLLMAFSFKMAL